MAKYKSARDKAAARRKAGKNTGKKEPSSRKKETKKDSGSSFLYMSTWIMVLVAILPFLFTRESMDPSIPIRYGFLSLFLVAFIGFFFGLRKTPVSTSFDPFTRWVFLIGLGFGAWSFISMLFATNSTAGIYDVARHFAHLLLLFVVMEAVRQEPQRLIYIFRTLVVVAILQSIVGIFQHYEIGFENIPGVETAKPYGMMSNRNLFGSGQMLLLPFIIYTLYKDNKAWRNTALAALGLIFISIFISQTRSAWAATLASLFTVFVLGLIFFPESRKKWLINSGIIMGGAALLLTLVTFSSTNSSFTRSIQNRAASMVQPTTKKVPSSESVTERFIIWKQSADLMFDHPLFGVGPANWKVVIPKYGSDGLVNATGIRTRLRPHNVYLQIGGENGIPGILLYLGMWGMLAFLAFRVLIKSTDKDRKFLSLAMLAGLAGLASDAMWSFPTDRIEHSVYIFLMAGVILALNELESRQESPGSKPAPIPVWAWALMLIVAGFNLLMAQQKYQFEHHYLYAKAHLDNANRNADGARKAANFKRP